MLANNGDAMPGNLKMSVRSRRIGSVKMKNIVKNKTPSLFLKRNVVISARSSCNGVQGRNTDITKQSKTKTKGLIGKKRGKN